MPLSTELCRRCRQGWKRRRNRYVSKTPWVTFTHNFCIFFDKRSVSVSPAQVFTKWPPLVFFSSAVNRIVYSPRGKFFRPCSNINTFSYDFGQNIRVVSWCLINDRLAKHKGITWPWLSSHFVIIRSEELVVAVMTESKQQRAELSSHIHMEHCAVT